MITFEPPHKATDRSKLASLVRALRNGAEINPVVVSGEQATTGSHRVEAARIAKVDVPFVRISDADYLRACYAAEIETHVDNLNAFCAAVLLVSDDTEILAAMADQHDGDYIDSDRAAEAREMSTEELRNVRGW